jgi:hypothetical protein
VSAAEVRALLDDTPEVPPMVQAWVAQLLSPEFLATMRAIPFEQIDVRLSASRGRARKNPTITLNGGPPVY